MLSAVFLFLVCSLVLITSPTSECVPNKGTTSYDHYYQRWLNYQLERFGKNAETFAGNKKQILWNSTKFDEFKLNVSTHRGWIDLNLRKVKFEGFSNIVVKKLETRITYGRTEGDKLRDDRLHYEIAVRIPMLRLDARYDASAMWEDVSNKTVRSGASKQIDCGGKIIHIFKNVTANLMIKIKQADDRIGAEVTEVMIARKFRIKPKNIVRPDSTPCKGIPWASLKEVDYYNLVLDKWKPVLLPMFQKKILVGLNNLLRHFPYHNAIMGTANL